MSLVCVVLRCVCCVPCVRTACRARSCVSMRVLRVLRVIRHACVALFTITHLSTSTYIHLVDKHRAQRIFDTMFGVVYGYTCDECEQSIPKPQPRMHCWECDYDVCMKCLPKAPPHPHSLMSRETGIPLFFPPFFFSFLVCIFFCIYVDFL